MTRLRTLLLLGVLTVLSAALARPGDASAAFFSTDIVGDADCSGGLNGMDALAVGIDLAGLDPLAPCIGVANIHCEDALNTDDWVALLRVLADLPIDQPGRCFVPGVPIPSNPISQGSATIHGTSTFDFDAGMEVGSGADVWWENLLSADPIDMKLEATGGMTALLTGAEYGALNVVALNTTVYSSATIDGPDGPAAAPDGPNDLPVGAVFAVLTDEGNYAKVQVVQSGYNLEIDWVTYSE